MPPLRRQHFIEVKAFGVGRALSPGVAQIPRSVQSLRNLHGVSWAHIER